MTDAAPTPTSSMSGDTNQGPGNPPSKSIRHRFKPQLSCIFCRNRKLKCDRNLPCENCVKRDLSSSCSYLHAGVQKTNSGSRFRDVQSQIRHLESLVVSLMNKTSQNGPLSTQIELDVTPDTSPESDTQMHHITRSAQVHQSSETAGAGPKEIAESFGRISIGEGQPNYAGSSHWTAILENIACLKTQLDSPSIAQQDNDLMPSLDGPLLLVGSVRSATRAEILACMPTRSVVDLLVYKYLEIPDVGTAIIHVPTFKREYEKFWKNPETTPIMWIGLLFAMLCLCIQYELLSGDETFQTLEGWALKNPADAVSIFREKIVQCLVLGNYTRPGPYTVETLMLYYISDHFRSPDAQFGTWMVFGLIVRTAMRLGLHRDPSHFPKISVFQGEMRRRTFASIMELDLLTSLQMGLPRAVRDGMYDTKPPRNLFDEDFDENSKALPFSRPNNELTSIGYMNSNHRIIEVLGVILDQANSIYPISYKEVMALDARLHDVYKESPTALQVRNLEDFKTGSPVERLQKCIIDLSFQKARCVLHRKFFLPPQTPIMYPYPYSTEACVDASMRILQSQVLAHGDSRRGKLLWTHRWKTTSLITHDYLLAAMLICLYLGHSASVNLTDQGDPRGGINPKWTHAEMMHALQGSYQIWEELSASSKDATKAAKTLKAVLLKVQCTGQTQATNQRFSQSQQRSQDGRHDLIHPSNCAYGNENNLSNDSQEEQSISLNSRQFIPSSGVSRSWIDPSSFLSRQLSEHSILGPPSSITGNAASEMLDWEVWDNQFYDNNLINAPTELSNFDSTLAFQDPSANIMQWDQQIDFGVQGSRGC